MKADVLIIDGRHLLYRTSDAFRELSANVDGHEIGTGGIYGFLTCLLRVHFRWGGAVFVAWEGRDNFRFKLYPDYKRKGEPDEDKRAFIEDMYEQELRLKKLLCLIGVRQHIAVRCEADDVIGTLARKGEEKGLDVVVYSGDSDLRQLVSERVRTVSPGFRGDDTVYDAKKVFEKHGVEPKQIPDLKALTGDTSDNIPGISGVGPVTAAKLIQQYGDVEKVIASSFAAVAGLKGWPVAERFAKVISDNADKLRLYKQLTTVKCDAEMKRITPSRNKVALLEEFRRYKFRTLLAPAEMMALGKLAA